MNTNTILTENIPYDLAKAYKTFYNDGNQASETRKYSNIYHGDIAKQGRRHIELDYGKASYTELSKEQALNMLKNDKDNIHNLRLIVQGNLVILEKRPNGTIYPTYRNTNSITLDGRTYKNLGFVTPKNLIINASKIYYTDEYDHILTPEQDAEREEKKKVDLIYSMNNERDDYDDLTHNPYTSRTKGFKAIPRCLDTGDHKPWSRDRYDKIYNSGILDASNLEKDTYEKIYWDRNTESVYNTYKNYFNALKRKKLAYKDYDSARNDLKLAKNALKDDPDNEYRKEVVERAEITLKTFYEANMAAAKELRKTKDDILRYVDAKSVQTNTLLIRLAAKIEVLLEKSHKLEREYENLVSNDISTKAFNYKTYAYNSIIKSLQSYIEDLNHYKDKVSKLQSENKDHIAEHAAIIDISKKIQNQYEELKELDVDNLAEYEKRINVLEKQAGEANDARKTLGRFKKGIKKEESRKELDSELADLISFTDLRDDTENEQASISSLEASVSESKKHSYSDLTSIKHLTEAVYGMNGKAITFNDMIKTLFKQKIIDIFMNTSKIQYCNNVNTLLTDPNLSPKPFFTFVSNASGSHKNDVAGLVIHHIIYGCNPIAVKMTLQNHTKLHNRINAAIAQNLPDIMRDIYKKYYVDPIHAIGGMIGTYANDIVRIALFEDCIRRMAFELKQLQIDTNTLKITLNNDEFQKLEAECKNKNLNVTTIENIEVDNIDIDPTNAVSEDSSQKDNSEKSS